LLWGFWNGLTAWIVLIAHVFGGWDSQPVYDLARAGNWYDFGFLLGAGSPIFGAFGRKAQASRTQTGSGDERRHVAADSELS
ncbi:MAG TPA: hypothetical protein VMM78_18305, partial [Thermomicrobiales bacterium]|nr:hypothetical protein [Thermomicrobiales bacterium]